MSWSSTYAVHRIKAPVNAGQTELPLRDLLFRAVKYTTNMKPDIPDYDWIIFGVRVKRTRHQDRNWLQIRGHSNWWVRSMPNGLGGNSHITLTHSIAISVKLSALPASHVDR